MSRVSTYLERLRGIATNAGVRVEFLEVYLEGGEEWDGLYIMCKELGPGIAINRRLSPKWQVWVLAHELGHHFDQQQSELFSPLRQVHML